jgi:Ca2+-binding EF-hand superfamily protein
MSDSAIGRERISKLWDAFRGFDTDGNGVISGEELGQVLRELGQEVSPAQLREMIADVDLDGSCTIDFDEFCALMVSSFGDREARLRAAFEVLDPESTGRIELPDLEPIMRRFGLSADELSKMFEEVNTDGDRTLGLEEFMALMPEETDPDGYRSSPEFAPVDATDYEYDPTLYEHKTLQEEAAAGDPTALELVEKLLRKQARDSHLQRQGTSRLQVQIGVFRLIQGAAYRSFRESFSANHETHLRVRNLPYRITDFVEFTRLTLEIYKGLGVVDPACFPVIDEVQLSLTREFERLKDRIKNWEGVAKTPEMLAEARRMEAVLERSTTQRQKFAAGIEFAIALKKQKLAIRDAVEGVLAMHELNRLRRIELGQELHSTAEPESENDPREYLARWNRVIVDEANEHVPGAMMPVAYWYAEFMPRLLAAMSVEAPADISENTVPDEAALDRWYRETRESGEFACYGSDVEENFPNCSPERKLAIRQAWRLTRHYLNGAQKRRERVEAGRETGALSQYVAFTDVYLGRRYVEQADMRVSFPYYLGPPVWRLLHTTAEILCEMSQERQKRGLGIFVSFFKLFASMYPCPYCRHHLNAYVVQNREVSMYPLEYLVLGHDANRTELRMSATEKLESVSSGPELRLFFWKLHNTVSSSIFRTESWFRRDEKAFYTSRFWPGLESELARAQALQHISITTDQIARIYGLLKPAGRLAGLRAELQHVLGSRDEDDLRRIFKLTQEYVAELESAVLDGRFLQDTYHFDPERVDPPPAFSPEEEAFARSGSFVESI